MFSAVNGDAANGATLREVRLHCRAARAEHEAERADFKAGGQLRDARQRRHEDAVHEHQFRRGLGAEGPPCQVGGGNVQQFTGHERGVGDWRDGREAPFLVAGRREALRREGGHGALALLAQPRGPAGPALRVRLEFAEEPCARR